MSNHDLLGDFAILEVSPEHMGLRSSIGGGGADVEPSGDADKTSGPDMTGPNSIGKLNMNTSNLDEKVVNPSSIVKPNLTGSSNSAIDGRKSSVDCEVNKSIPSGATARTTPNLENMTAGQINDFTSKSMMNITLQAKDESSMMPDGLNSTMMWMFMQLNNSFNQMKEENRQGREESKEGIRQAKEEIRLSKDENRKELNKIRQELGVMKENENLKNNGIAMDVDNPNESNSVKEQSVSSATNGAITSHIGPQISPQVLEMSHQIDKMITKIQLSIEHLPLSIFGNNVMNNYYNIKEEKEKINAGFKKYSEKEMLDIFQQCKQFLHSFLKEVGEKKFLSDLMERGVKYLEKGCHISHESRIMCDSKLYVFYFSWSKVECNQQIWNFFKCLIDYRDSDKKEEKICLAVYDMESEEKPPRLKDVIQIYQNGDLVCEDLFHQISQFEHVCSAFSGKYETRPIPVKKVDFEAPCPLAKENTCPSKDARWICVNCQQLLVYGFDLYLYCHCGASKVENVRFKCDVQKHGTRYVFHEKEDIQSLLDNLRSFNGKTVLILGETGVGKSTFINGFANYMQYSTLEEAKVSEDLLSPVKSTFIMTNDDFEQVVISTGNEDNECQKVGQSATQGTKAHVFNYKGSVDVRLIDTPGIGDTRGIEQDKENFKNILAYISYYEEIHGICILLKPNNSRLTIMFEFCIKELLTHLHKDVAKNIVFCFTNARNTNYRPGDTFPALKELLEQSGHQTDLKLSKENVFCMDNESFRYLAACKNGIGFTDEDDKVYGASWERAASETNRMMKYISNLKSHKVKDTLSINDVRRKILDMTKPLAEIAKHIDTTVMNLEDQKTEIDNSQLEANEILAKINIQVPSLERKTLPYPRTVCTSLNCHEVHKMDGQDVKKFTTHCHEHCHLNGVQTDVTNNPDLKNCAAMSRSGGAYCQQCGCSWNTHMHVTYEMVSVMKAGEDISAKQNYQGITDRIKLKEVVVADYERVIRELQLEKEQILRASASFGIFIKENSVIPYNDAMMSYLNLLIKMEREKADQSQDFSKVDNMMQLKLQYEQEVQIMKDATSDCVAEGDYDKIAGIQNQDNIMTNLFSLKHFGQNMKTLLTQMEEDRKLKVTFEENRYVTKPSVWKKVGVSISSSATAVYKFIVDSPKQILGYMQSTIASRSKNQLKYEDRNKPNDEYPHLQRGSSYNTFEYHTNGRGLGPVQREFSYSPHQYETFGRGQGHRRGGQEKNLSHAIYPSGSEERLHRGYPY